MALADAQSLAASIETAIADVDEQGRVVVEFSDAFLQLAMRISFEEADDGTVSLEFLE